MSLNVSAADGYGQAEWNTQSVVLGVKRLTGIHQGEGKKAMPKQSPNEPVVEIKLWQGKCDFCGQKFAGPDKAKVHQGLIDHIDNTCKVLKCLCIIKNIEYPLKVKRNEATAK